jgi:hypothetical protein
VRNDGQECLGAASSSVIARHVSVVAIFPPVSTEPAYRKIATAASRLRNDVGVGLHASAAPTAVRRAQWPWRETRGSLLPQTEAERCLHRRRHDGRPTANPLSFRPTATLCHFDRPLPSVISTD